MKEFLMHALRYINEILNPFFVNLAPGEERFGYFMQDGTIPHIANETIRALCGVSRINGEDRTISKGLLVP
jgi:hypothetical protein